MCKRANDNLCTEEQTSKHELNEIMKEFNRHDLVALVSMNWLKNTRILTIDTTIHDNIIIQKYIDKVVEEFEMELKASRGYSTERVCAFSRAIEIVKRGGIRNDRKSNS